MDYILLLLYYQSMCMYYMNAYYFRTYMKKTVMDGYTTTIPYNRKGSNFSHIRTLQAMQRIFGIPEENGPKVRPFHCTILCTTTVRIRYAHLCNVNSNIEFNIMMRLV